MHSSQEGLKKDVTKLSKRAFFTAAGIIIAFSVAIGGWALTSRLIDMESERLLAHTTTFTLNMPMPEPINQNEDDDPEAGLSLTVHEMVSVLRNWEALYHSEPRHTSPPLRRVLHEPAEGQINMMQAVEAAREGVLFLQEYNLVPAELLSFNDTRAYLGQNLSYNGEFLPLQYSYWNVYFVNDYLHVLMTINAATGQLWQIQLEVRHMPILAHEAWIRTVGYGIVSMDINDIDLRNTLAAFMTNAGMDFDKEAIFVIQDELTEFPPPVQLFPPHRRFFDQRPYIFMYNDRRYIMQLSRPLAQYRFADGDASALIAAAGIITEEGTLHFSRLTIALVIQGVWFF